MTSLQPRKPYSPQELAKLYPDELELQQVQVLFRHGERTPISARFQNAGLPKFWPYCSIARQMVSSTVEACGSKDQWSNLQWQRRIETFDKDDSAILATGPEKEIDSLCTMGELTDSGRASTYKLGERLRYLYVDQLKFMPASFEHVGSVHLRATPIPRALESLQQTFTGFYPPTTRASSLGPVTIMTRTVDDETLYPNEFKCRRFHQLSKAFAQRAAERWNHTSEMDYLNRLLGKWMPENSKIIAVDSHPRISGILDTINSTLAHGPQTRLPKEFYDPRAREILEKIGIEEWFDGYKESQEYRALGIGSLMGDLVDRMVSCTKAYRNNQRVDGQDKMTLINSDQHDAKLSLSGCHDTTLAAILASLGAFNSKSWPPYTSHIAFELFKKKTTATKITAEVSKQDDSNDNFMRKIHKVFENKLQVPTVQTQNKRQNIQDFKQSDRSKIQGYYVRLRYNDEIMSIPGCTKLGNHLDGDESFCTLEAFKSIVDKFVPISWGKECEANLKAPAFPATTQPPGN